MANILLGLRIRSALANSAQYRPDIDGLRALAVLPVLFFHAAIPGFSGGFVGVDVFYVISGYLITSIIERDLALERFSMASFYERRVRRIFPALFTVVVVSLLMSMILLDPLALRDLGKSLSAMTLLSSNIYFAHHSGADGYFGDDSGLQVLLHTWSLSVEEQFYVVFPTALVLLTRWSGRRPGAYLWLAALASFGACLWQTPHQPISAFYLPLSRAWELLIGAVLALKLVPTLQQRGRDVLGIVGLGLLTWAIIFFDKSTQIPGYAALMPCGGAVLIIYAGENGGSLVGRFLKLRPLVFVGLISYSLYLWHWPLLVFAKYFRAGDLSATDVIAVLCVAFTLAVLSFEFVESPLRGSHTGISRNRIFVLGAAVCVLSAVAGFSIYLSGGFPQRFPEATRTIISRNLEREADYLDVCSNWKRDIRRPADMNLCRLGMQSQRTVMFWGDSHVQQLYPLIERISASGGLYGHGAVFAVNEGCTPAEHLNRPERGFYCDSFSRYAMLRAEQPDVDVVFVGFAAPPVLNLCESRGGRCTYVLSSAEATKRVLEELSTHIHALRALGKRVIVSLPFPLYDRSIPQLQIRNAILTRWGSVEVARERTLPSMRAGIAAVAAETGADVFDPRASLCNGDRCVTEIAGVSIYKDHSHIAETQIGILEDNMRRTLARTTMATDLAAPGTDSALRQ